MAHNAEDPVGAALRNELILQEIFKFLPLKSLVTSGRVNNLWNNRTRTYLRDHRKSTAFISSPTLSPCHELEQLDQDLAGRTLVPFNSLSSNLRSHTECPYRILRSSHRDDGNPLENFHICNYENIFSKLKLKYLSFSWAEDVDVCSGTFLISRLLTETANQLTGLSLKRISTRCMNHLAVMDLDFPRLQELELRYLKKWLTEDKGEDLLQKFLDGAPNLERIIHNGDPRILYILPENKYRLLSKLNFDGADKEEELLDLVRKLIESGPRISELSANFDYRRESDLPAACLSVFQSLVQSCTGSLKILKMFGATSVEKIGRFSPLPNLTVLSLKSKRCPPFEFLNKFQLIRFGELFPRLERFDLYLSYPHIMHFPPAGSEDQECTELGGGIGLDPLRCSTTVKVLNLNMELCPVELLRLRIAFPNVVQVNIWPRTGTAHALSYGEIFRCWPNLKNLVISRSEGQLKKALTNCDAEFCGIHQEELELLWEKGEEYLSNVHIVPVRQCVSTMKDLESLSINFRIRRCDPPPHYVHDPRLMFLSPVTEFLLFKRMPGLNFNLKLAHE